MIETSKTLKNTLFEVSPFLCLVDPFPLLWGYGKGVVNKNFEILKYYFLTRILMRAACLLLHLPLIFIDSFFF